MTDPFLHNLVQPNKSAAADEENLLGVYLDVFLVRVFPAALRRNVARAAFEDLEQRLLHAFARNVPCDADVVSLAANLVDLVDVNDPNLGALDVVVSILKQTENDVLHIFPHVARFSQRGCIRDAKGHIQDFSESFCQQGLAGSRRSDKKNIALLDFDVSEWIGLKSCGCVGWSGVLQDALEMIMDGDREGLFCDVLADDILVEGTPNVSRLRNPNRR